MKTVSRFRRNRKTPLSRCNGKTAQNFPARTGGKEIDMESIALNDAEITLIVWGLAGGLLGLLSVLLAKVVLQ